MDWIELTLNGIIILCITVCTFINAAWMLYQVSDRKRTFSLEEKEQRKIDKLDWFDLERYCQDLQDDIVVSSMDVEMGNRGALVVKVNLVERLKIVQAEMERRIEI